MLYRGWINGKKIITTDLNELAACEIVDIYINQIWQVYR